jgi:hypothetical protein
MDGVAHLLLVLLILSLIRLHDLCGLVYRIAALADGVLTWFRGLGAPAPCGRRGGLAKRIWDGGAEKG